MAGGPPATLAHVDVASGRTHPLDQHLIEVGALAQGFTEAFGAGPWGLVAGLVHDLGKSSSQFQRRLQGALEAVDHSTAGAQWLFKHFGPEGRLLAYAVAGHHAGLPNGTDETQRSLTARLDKVVPTWDLELLTALDAPEALGAFPIRVANGQRREFQVGFLIRMAFSCLVDADFLDTERFFTPALGHQRGGYPSLTDLRGRLYAHLTALAAGAQPSSVNMARAEVLAACRGGASLPPGLFSLTVPTGGGKTLASLAFALDHAQAHGLRRVIYAIPYTSIIEQTATVFRGALGDDAVVEHHSNFDPAAGTPGNDPLDSSDDSTRPDVRRVRLASENWDAPVVVTTNVQFFESLFHNRPSRCRRLHNIARSVVILDEAQTLPPDYLLPCLEALRELALNYGVSIVLCTATQPVLSRREGFSAGLAGVRELMPDPARLAQRLVRVTLHQEDVLDDGVLAARIAAEPRVLCIVNTRRHAARLFGAVRGQEGAFHLSANMCPAHRAAQLVTIRGRLDNKQPCRVVSTQLIEAGVDVDFPVVYRAAAGTDSLAQAAGRCNREGSLSSGHVHVFDVERADLPPGLLRQSAEEGRTVLRRHGTQALAPRAIEEYFKALYWRRGEQLDRHNILRDFTEGAGRGNFAFRDVAERFQLIQQLGEPVIIRWDDNACRLVAQLADTETPRGLLRRLQRYTVNVPSQALAQLDVAGALTVYQEHYRVLTKNMHYCDDVGLRPDVPADPADLVV